MTHDNRAPKVQGSIDPHMPDCVMVPLDRPHRSFPAINSNLVPPGTFYRYSNNRRKVLCLVTLSPQGVYVAWEMCGGCFNYFSRCACAKGIAAPSSVARIAEWAPTPRETHISPPAASTGWSTDTPSKPSGLRKNGDRPPLIKNGRISGTPLVKRSPLRKKSEPERETAPEFHELDNQASGTADRLTTLLKKRIRG